ncbi:DgyrCDS11804 [Dimorphilus gyrociliatus]|uniref:DgyrCDS11804 n=1 Tax=Dimorphilus gyrociliatus TaxID=2664684 RepID=A0A7I8W8B5_9ANNE|nr:DgyrCDS11804 [Dimorphilus gyrociliatus]
MEDSKSSTYTPMEDGGPPSRCGREPETGSEKKRDSSNVCSSKQTYNSRELNEGEISAKKAKTETSNAEKILAKDYGYYFNDNGELVHNDTKDKFVYEFYDQKSKNQERYENIGDLITEIIYEKLESEFKLKKYNMKGRPFQNSDDKDGFVFATDDFNQKDKILLLIHGSGVVRAGQWARRLIINESLKTGTQFEYIKRGIEENFGVIVLNTNHNKNKHGEKFDLSETPERHGENVWKYFVEDLKNTQVAIVAHSYGGVVTSAIMKKYKQSCEEKVFAVAFTDAIDYGTPKFLKHKVKNWVTSKEKLGSKLTERNSEIVEMFSAGTTAHEETSASAFEEVFNFILHSLANNGK